jgi:macrolide transport system ATP-binding/permease protein
LIDLLRTDLRHALRWLAKSPAFTLVAVASLAAGIGFNAALFAVADAVIFRPLPVVEPNRLVDVFTSGTGGAGAEPYSTSSYPDYLDLRARNDVFTDVIGYSPMFGPLNLGDRSQLVLGEIVTGNYFGTLGVGAALGRTIVSDDDRKDAPRVAMVSYRSWVRDFGSSRETIGRTLKLRGETYAIVGVTPRGFTGMTPVLSPDVWVPVAGSLTVEPVGLHDVVPSPDGTNRLERRGDRWLFMRGRLQPGRTAAQAGANLELLMSRLDAAYPATNKDRRIAVKATNDVHLHPAADRAVVPIAAVLMVIVGLVLLIACANVASMLLARATGRQKEIAVRLAIGASRAQIARQLVTESLVLSSIGAAFGILLAWWITRIVASLSLPTPIPFAFELRIDGRVLLFTLAATFVSGLLAGLVPAIKASRVTLTSDLRGDLVVRPMGGWRWGVRDVLVAGQMATTVLLLVVATLLTRSLIAAERTDVGFAVDRLALVSTDTGMLRYSPARSLQFYSQALDRVRAIPGVESAALATRVPFSVNVSRWDDIWIPGRHQPGQTGDTIDVTRVSADYFRTVGVAIVQGRGFTDDDRPETPKVAVVNETFARRYWPDESAIGKVFHTRGGAGPAFQIVGVSADHKISTVGEAPTPFIHVSRSQQPNAYNAIIARTRGDANALLRDMRRELLALEPNLVFFENQTMEAEMGATLFPVRAEALVVSSVGLVAMLLAAIGLYGVIAYSVSRRTREIGIRMALGASASTVLRLVMRQGLIVAAVGLAGGVVVGCAVALLARSQISGMLYGVSIADPLSWGIAAAVLLTASSLANFIPAWRAARVQPSQALRTE